MFARDDIYEFAASDRFRGDYAAVLLAQAQHRLGFSAELDGCVARRLRRFVTVVLASAPRWTRGDLSAELTRRAAEVAETLAVARGDEEDAWLGRIQAALLYELAEQPMMAAALVHERDAPQPLVDLFRRAAAFKSLAADASERPIWVTDGDTDLLRLALAQDAVDLADYLHGPDHNRLLDDAGALEDAARYFSLELGLTEVRAFEEVVRRRSQRATRHRLPDDVLPAARTAGLPAELWEAQARLLDDGLLTPGTTWGIGAPTGTGKTFLARMLVLTTLVGSPDTKVLYLVPSNALVGQVTRDLAEQLEAAGIVVSAVRPQLVALDEREHDELVDSQVLVLTPEKADLLLRIGATFLDDVGLVVVDEAHLIEDGTRGTLLELYLMRLKARFAIQARYVLLSAVAPNVGQIAEWVTPEAQSRLFRRRATRMRVGIYRVRKPKHRNQGWIDYVDGPSVRVVSKGVEMGQNEGIAQLARHLSVSGSVFVVARGQGTAEDIAKRLREQLVEAGGGRLSDEALGSDVMQRLDSRLEREMYAKVPLRGLIRYGIAYHHAGLPPRVREAVEAAILSNHVQYVVATTTLGEGVNFPFSSVIVQSLSVRERPEPGRAPTWRLVTPRTFWNIAGRAGRPGMESEGQVILFEPSLALDKMNAVLGPYVTPNIEDIEPVRSALATSLEALALNTATHDIELDELDTIALSSNLPRGVQGLVNLVRVGIAHARASGMVGAPADLFDATFAAHTLGDDARAFGRKIFDRQAAVVDRYLAGPGAPPVDSSRSLGCRWRRCQRCKSTSAHLPSGNCAACKTQCTERVSILAR